MRPIIQARKRTPTSADLPEPRGGDDEEFLDLPRDHVLELPHPFSLMLEGGELPDEVDEGWEIVAGLLYPL